ncbi:MAG: mercury resistance system periplasmic binding protein MerP [Gammaproteobacteria bacterium]|nr:mercury resistance system periplasmic binding protein MerP [Gammaproteobacteria bacterium]
MRKLTHIILLTALVADPTWASERTVNLNVDNMSCPACAPIVKTSLMRIQGVVRSEVSTETNTATVTFDDAKTGVAALIDATTKAGYPSRLAP